MNEVVTALIGFLLGLCASWVWWRYLLSLKPNVRISLHALKGNTLIRPDEITESDEIVYRIKLINYGSRQVIELQASAEIRERREKRWRLVKSLELQFDGSLPALGM